MNRKGLEEPPFQAPGGHLLYLPHLLGLQQNRNSGNNKTNLTLFSCRALLLSLNIPSTFLP